MPLSRWLKAFPTMAALHPFEAALLDLTVGAATYASVLGKVDALRKSLQEVRVKPLVFELRCDLKACSWTKSSKCSCL